jgi:hypothetical protein
VPDTDCTRCHDAYRKAAIDLEVALDVRRRIRRQIAGRRKPSSGPRRIIGVRPGAQHYAGPMGPPPPRPAPPPFRVYMGDILGLQAFRALPSDPSGGTDPAFDFDMDALMEESARRGIAKARRKLEETRKDLVECERRKRTEAFRRSAARARKHLEAAGQYGLAAGNVALLGVDDQLPVGWRSEDRLAEAHEEVLAFCRGIWEAYRRASDSPVAQKALIAAVGEAHLYTVDDDDPVPDMVREVYRIVETLQGAPGTPSATPRPPGGSR